MTTGAHSVNLAWAFIDFRNVCIATEKSKLYNNYIYIKVDAFLTNDNTKNIAFLLTYIVYLSF